MPRREEEPDLDGKLLDRDQRLFQNCRILFDDRRGPRRFLRGLESEIAASKGEASTESGDAKAVRLGPYYPAWSQFDRPFVCKNPDPILAKDNGYRGPQPSSMSRSA